MYEEFFSILSGQVATCDAADMGVAVSAVGHGSLHPGTEQARQHRAHCARFCRYSRRRPAARCAVAGGTERPKVPSVARCPLGRVGISGGQRRLVGINVNCEHAA